MKPDEIINGLNAVKEVYQPKNAQAIDAAIQAVELLEEIKKELRGECCACAHRDCPVDEFPCRSCLREKWEFRWPLGEDAAT